MSEPVLPARVPLPLPVQIGYAAADLGINAVETALRLYLLIFYTDEVGLRPGLAGLAIGLGLVWDAVTDPLMGAISDRTLHRFGGRRGYLLAGGTLLTLGVLAVFWVPRLDTEAAKFAWLLCSFCFLNTGLTVLNVPHMAMAGEMTLDPHDRAVLFGWRFASANLGAVLAAALPALLLGTGGGRTVAAMGPVSVCIGFAVLATTATTFHATRGVRFLTTAAAPEPFLRSFLAALRNPAFRPLLLAYVVATIGIGLNAATALYYYGYALELADHQVQQLLVVFIAVFTVSLVGWVRLSRRLGKRRPLAAGAVAVGCCNSVLYLLLPPGNFLLPLLFGAVGLGLLVGCVVLLDTMLTDVLDHDRLRTRRQRSGLFFGVWRFSSKLARAAALGAAGLVLDLAGFVPNQEQASSVQLTLTLLFGPGVGLFFLLAGFILGRYRFDEPKQAQVRRLLDERDRRPARGGSPVTAIAPHPTRSSGP